MSDVDDNDIDDGNDGAGAPKALREQNSKLNKQVEDLQKQLNTLLGEKRQNTIADALRAKEANPKLAKYVARDLEGDVTAEAVEKWLEDEGELFGYTPPSAEDDDNATQQERVAEASSRAPQPTTGITPEKLKSMTTQQLIEAGYLDPM